MNHLSSLNESQRDAATSINGPVLVLAGPGSGKTRVLTHRVAYLLQEGIDPFSILALTFTNKSAREMKERIIKITGSSARNIWMGTFHSIFARILRMEAEKIGYSKSFTIYDNTDSKSLLKSIIKHEGLSDKLYKPAMVLNRISLAKNNLISPKAYAKNTELISDDESSGRPKMAYLYETYSKRCFQSNAMDFDDLLFKTAELFNKSPETLYKYQHIFRHILIDEFQDTNFLQFMIIKKLADVFQNICVVGDDAQSIYSFRGANIKNMLYFKKSFPELKTIKLEQNYRSSKTIVNAANLIIKQNQRQLAKQIWTDNEEGEKINLIEAVSDSDEGRQVSESILETKLRHHYNNSEFAILYRTNAQSRAFEEWLRKLDIPYRIYGGLSFYQRKEIKDFLAYLRLTINPNDEEALKRVINFPTRGIGLSSVQKLIIEADKNSCSIWDIVLNIEQHPDLNNRAKQAIILFRTLINSLMVINKNTNAYDMAMSVNKETGIGQMLFKDKTVEGISRYENLQELLNSIQEFVESRSDLLNEDGSQSSTDLNTYLEDVSLLTSIDENDDDNDKVTLMTIHASKGLEFTNVYVSGLEEELFPSSLSMNFKEDIEEERRLFYVAITRAEKHLNLSYAQSRYRFGNLLHCKHSRFIDELNIKVQNKSFEFKAKPKSNFSNKFKGIQTKKTPSKTFTKPLLKKSKPAPVDLSSFNADDTSKLKSGMNILHQKFGNGKVLSIDGNDNNRIANIFFPDSGQKKIMLKYAKLQIIKG